jgi:hypothetical protein
MRRKINVEAAASRSERVLAAREVRASLTDAKAVDLVARRRQLEEGLQHKVARIVKAVGEAEARLAGLQKAGGGSIGAAEILRSYALEPVSDLQRLCASIAKQLE